MKIDKTATITESHAINIALVRSAHGHQNIDEGAISLAKPLQNMQHKRTGCIARHFDCKRYAKQAWSSFNNCTQNKKQVSHSEKKRPFDDDGQKKER